MRSIIYWIYVKSQSSKQLNKTDILVIHTTNHFQSTVKTLSKALFNMLERVES